ncbi:uncharacterized protein SPAPADRAFT_60630 [Spathaspora passalidarum NRRL Y-27907]|uniref:DUF1746 domain-containing protein n=1 Tax=Spathaspora passalidarum (strain NRRL Y-27907 / 11-Y1) TaxID=619300 RepID=G3ALQ2_SPAPN|nr:uncharacterized protein SPAPADRAFT_60630 [Spathaspora passalidarum NRRL Y-27907]EGW33295.1 hypothetical protein SPAPADRAFT_60630 [Spathaspora passalidarum NRRL Y-27907]
MNINLEQYVREFTTRQYPTQEQTITNNKQILYKRKKFFLRDLRESIRTIEIVLIAIIYLRDISLLRLFIRVMIHFGIVNIHPPAGISIEVSEAHKKSMIKIALLNVISGNIICILLHLLFGVQEGGTLYGGISIEFIGERVPYNRFELILLDLFVFFIQLVFHNIVGVLNDSEILESPQQATELVESGSLDRAHIEGDGYDGNVFLLSMDLIGNIKRVLRHDIYIQRIDTPNVQAQDIPGAFHSRSVFV